MTQPLELPLFHVDSGPPSQAVVDRPRRSTPTITRERYEHVTGRVKLLSWLSLAWMTVEGAVAIGAGIVAGSKRQMMITLARPSWSMTRRSMARRCGFRKARSSAASSRPCQSRTGEIRRRRAGPSARPSRLAAHIIPPRGDEVSWKGEETA